MRSKHQIDYINTILDTMSSHDIEGQDVETSVNSGESARNAPRKHGRILLSIVVSGELVENVVILLPDSYLVRFI